MKNETAGIAEKRLIEEIVTILQTAVQSKGVPKTGEVTKKGGIRKKVEYGRVSKKQRNLFILEGLLMCLEPKSFKETFHRIRESGGTGSRVNVVSRQSLL